MSFINHKASGHFLPVVWLVVGAGFWLKGLYIKTWISENVSKGSKGQSAAPRHFPQGHRARYTLNTKWTASKSLKPIMYNGEMLFHSSEIVCCPFRFFLALCLGLYLSTLFKKMKVKRKEENNWLKATFSRDSIKALIWTVIARATMKLSLTCSGCYIQWNRNISSHSHWSILQPTRPLINITIVTTDNPSCIWFIE